MIENYFYESYPHLPYVKLRRFIGQEQAATLLGMSEYQLFQKAVTSKTVFGIHMHDQGIVYHPKGIFTLTGRRGIKLLRKAVKDPAYLQQLQKSRLVN